MKNGWRNNYNSKTKWIEVAGKDIKFVINDIKLYVKNGFKLPTILVYPDFPSKKTTIFKIARKLGFRLTNKLVSHPTLVMYFEDQTFGKQHSVLRSTYSNVLNIDCVDISKKKVDEVHLSVFGYNTFIDPSLYNGKAVQKSDINALHDGKIISCPTPIKEKGSVYQLLIDNAYDDQYVLDYRVPVVKNSIPFCYKKFKKLEVRFTNEVSHTELCEIDKCFSLEEINQIIDFAKAMKVDFCELDILRHSDGRIFIIDVNKTPYGPPAGLKESSTAVNSLTQLFEASFLK